MKKTFKPSKKQCTSLFFFFLKQNKAYDSFMRNFSNLDFAHAIVDFEKVSPDFYVAGAFYWASTPEGLDYWRLIDSKWNLVVNLFKL